MNSSSTQAKPVKKEKKTRKDMEYWKLLKLAMAIEKKEKKAKQREPQKKSKLLKEIREKRRQKNSEKLPFQSKYMPKKNRSKEHKRDYPNIHRALWSDSIKGKYIEKNKLKYFVRKGNNQGLLLRLMKKRRWWSRVEGKDEGRN